MMAFEVMSMSSLFAVDAGERSTPDELSYFWEEEELVEGRARESASPCQLRRAA